MKHLCWLVLLLAGCTDTIEFDAVNQTVAPQPTKVAGDGVGCKKPIAAEETPVVKRPPCGCLGMHTFQPGVCRNCSQPTPFLEHKYCDGCTGNR